MKPPPKDMSLYESLGIEFFEPMFCFNLTKLSLNLTKLSLNSVKLS